MKEKPRTLNLIKWLIVILIIAIISNYIYNDINIFKKILIIVPIIIVACSIIFLTSKGKTLIIFAQKVSAELYKITWPTYRETLNTTLIVIVLTIIISLMICGLDNILIHIISFIYNLRV